MKPSASLPRKTFLRVTIVLWLAVLGILIVLQMTQAQTPPPNLLTDPGFESGAPSHWTPKPGTTVFTLTQSTVFSGAWAAAVGSDGSTSTKAIVQAVPVISRTEYLLSGYVFKNDPHAKAARLRVAWYPTADCSGSQLSTADTPDLIADDPAFALLTATVTAPNAARCAQIRAQMQPLDKSPAVVFFDELGFAPHPIAPTPTPAPHVPLKITEVLYDALTPSTSGDEFVEICNPTNVDANLTGYKIGDEETPGKGEGMYRFPDATTLAMNACLLVAKNAAQFQTRFGFLPAFETVASGAGYTDTLTVPNLSRYTAWGKGSWALADTGDEVLLLSPADDVLDAVAYGSGDYGAAGVEPALTAAAPFSLQRVSSAADTNSMPLDFFRDDPTPGAPPVLPAPPLVPPSPLIADGLHAYFGAVAGETTIGGGDAPPALTLAHAGNAGLHFAALTDPGASLSSQNWTTTQSAAAALTIPGEFVALAGFSTISDAVNILGVDAPLTATATFSGVLDYLARQPTAVAQIDAGQLQNSSSAAEAIVLMPINTPTDPHTFDLTALQSAWAEGWRLAPAAAVPLRAPGWGSKITARTGIVAPELTRDAVLNALRMRRVFATTTARVALAARFGGQWMGSDDLLPGETSVSLFVRGDSSLSGTVTIFEGDTPLIAIAVSSLPFTGTVTVNLRPGHYYWTRLKTATGEMAVTAPVWVSGSPQPAEIWLNELLPSPRDHDWDGDGVADSSDEWVELFNPNDFPVNLRGWTLGDRAENQYIIPNDLLILPKGRLVVYRSASGIALNNDGDDLTLLRPDGTLADRVSYNADPGANISICRNRDTGEWQTRCSPTPGAPNVLLPPPAPLDLSIWDAKHITEGAWVRVRGYVTAPPGVIGKNTFYVQDETHGIRVKLPAHHNLWFAVGTHVEVTGHLNLYYNEWEIDVAETEDVRRLDGVRLIPPLPVNSGMLREGYEGLLVQLTATPLAFKKGSTSFWVDDGTGLAYVSVPGESGIHRADVSLGAPLTIVGIASQRTRSTPPRDGYRLLPRAPFDLVAQSPPPAVPEGWPSLLPATGFAPGQKVEMGESYDIPRSKNKFVHRDYCSDAHARGMRKRFACHRQSIPHYHRYSGDIPDAT